MRMKRNVLVVILLLALPLGIFTIAFIRGNSRREAAQAEALFAGLKTTEPSAGLEALKIMGPAAMPKLQEALKSPLSPVRVKAAWVLGRLGPVATNAVPDLIKGFDDDDLAVRMCSMESLKMIGTTRLDLVPKMVARLDRWAECYDAAELLDKIEQERKAMNLPPAYSDAYEYAMAFAHAATPAVRVKALPKLPQKDERSIAAFKSLLNDTNGWAREQTAIFLKDHNIVLNDTPRPLQVAP